MNYCSYFIKDKALFGHYPTFSDLEELVDNGVIYFIDLTCEKEDIVRYTQEDIIKLNPLCKKLDFPIPDMKVPTDVVEFSVFVIKIEKLIRGLKGQNKLYIHCRGGFGRSGLLVSVLLIRLHNISVISAIELTTNFRDNRQIMKPKYRRQLCPQTKAQREFVFNMFKPLYFYKAYRKGYCYGFSNFSLHSVFIKNFRQGESIYFPTSESAYQALKDPENKEYVEKLINTRSPYYAKAVGDRHIVSDWDKIKDVVMYKVLYLKFSQHPEIKTNLLNTGFRYLIDHNRYDCYWGDGGDDKGENKLGKILCNLREDFLLELAKV
jgi:ribA/ribD-fused uncharacterized protein